MKRKKVSAETEATVLISSRRRCCLCYYLRTDRSEKKGQIAHLNRDPSGSNAENLVFLCFEHHDEFDSRTSQSKGLTASEVRHHRDRLYKEVLADGPSGITTPIKATHDLHGYPEWAHTLLEDPEHQLSWMQRQWRPMFLQEGYAGHFAYKAGNRCDGVCLIQLMTLEDGTSVIACEQDDWNPGQSITNAVEAIAFQVCARLDIDPKRLVWLEHYNLRGHGDHDWTRVEFESTPPDTPFRGPSWYVMDHADWRTLGLTPVPSRSRTGLSIDRGLLRPRKQSVRFGNGAR